MWRQRETNALHQLVVVVEFVGNLLARLQGDYLIAGVEVVAEVVCMPVICQFWLHSTPFVR